MGEKAVIVAKKGDHIAVTVNDGGTLYLDSCDDAENIRVDVNGGTVSFDARQCGNISQIKGSNDAT